MYLTDKRHDPAQAPTRAWRQHDARPRRARPLHLACRGGLLRRLATLALVILVGYGLLLLEQASVTAAWQAPGDLLLPTGSVPASRRGTLPPPGTATATATVTPTVTLTFTPVFSDALSPTATATGTAPVPPTPVVSPTVAAPAAPLTATVLPPPAVVLPAATPTVPSPPPLAKRAPQAVELLWAVAQECTAGPIVDAANSIDLVFNDLVASCGPFGDGDSWTYTAFYDTFFPTVARARLEVRFYVSGHSNDGLALEGYNGLGWQTITTFGPADPPPGALTTLSYDVSALFSDPAQVNAAQLRFVVNQQGPLDGITLFLDEAGLEVEDVISTPTPLPPLPTPTTQPPAPTEVPLASDPHVDYVATTSVCASCHRAHTSAGLALRQAWPEEALCFACHAAAGPGTDVESLVTGLTNTATSFFKHDAAATSGVHRPGQVEGDDFGGANRHVECEDCHEPHEATRGAADAPMIQREMTLVAGVDPAWSAPGVPDAYTWLPQAEREYQVCFKCHSSFTTLPGYLPDGWDGSAYVADGLAKLTNVAPAQVPDSRDLAQEFNPYQASFHPVVAVGRNQSIPAGSFVGGWSQSSVVYCTDCHTNADAATAADGPHGSPRLHLLGGQAEYSTVYSSGSRVASGEVCFGCHNYDTYVTGTNSFTNFDHSGHLNNNRGTTCYTCHDSHGSEQLHLINFDASTMTFLDGRDSQTAWYLDSGGQAGCYLDCHGRSHNPLTYSP